MNNDFEFALLLFLDPIFQHSNIPLFREESET
jgi:hypothetical protein